MAAFPYQDTPFLLDSLYLSNTSSTKIKMPSLLEGGDINPCFSTYPSELLQEKTIDLRTHGSSCLNNNYCTTLGNTNEPLLTEISKTDSSSMVVELDGDDHKEPSVDKKRKNNDGSCLSSAQSQDTRRAKIKKQKKCSHRKEETEEKKSRSLMKKVVEEPPTGYIHVRARRGQATDSHSLAERVRREKISERMKLLQGLVPGCDKVSGKALMLDEIINYVQSLQYQVEFLSMKLASVDFGADLHANIIKSEPEKVSSRLGSALALQSSFMQQPTACYAAAAAAYTTTPATLTTKTSNYSVDEKDNAVSFQPKEQQGGQMLSEFSQEDNENLMIWDVYGYGQRQRLLLNQYDLNNLCSFH